MARQSNFEGCFVAEAFEGNTQAGFCNGSTYENCDVCPYNIDAASKSLMRKKWEEDL